MILDHCLKAEDIRYQTMKTLSENVMLKVAGYKCDSAMMWDVVLKASPEQASIEATCVDLEGVADSNTIREHLNEALPVTDIRLQETPMNHELAVSIPVSMKREGVDVAIDFHDESFYRVVM